MIIFLCLARPFIKSVCLKILLWAAVITVSATDADEGANGEVTYDFGRVSEEVDNYFRSTVKQGR